ncbi:ABC transporter ATP-binding protein [Specibacter sp. RAF43]|uniref:ABC transporter ATP-binding protein n=1 Tax=Specibacter sp. RAF43 TaxID=3233057 RepID=UPI003F9B7FF2
MTKHAEILLECSGISARYGHIRVCREVNFSVGAGEIVTVLGPNGAGKTSLLGSIAGIVAGEGAISVRGKSIDRLPAYRRARAGLRLVPEGRGLFGTMTVRENLLLGSRLAPEDRRHELIAKATQLFPVLADRMEQRARDMSGGEQQMLAVGKAIAGDPTVLMLDEPTQGLAPQVFDILRRALEALRNDGMGIVLVEQHHAFAASVADRNIVLVNGQIVHSGEAGQILGREALMASYTESEI